MKNVRKTIVTVAAIRLMMLFVTLSAAPESPRSFFAPPFCTCSRDLLDDVVLRLEEAEPPAPVGQVVDVVRQGLDEAIHLVDQPRQEGRADADDHDDHDQVCDGDRRPATEAPTRRSIQLTSGLSASARNSAITTHASTCRAIQTTSRVIATHSTMSRTRRTVRVRKSTTRSGVTVSASRNPSDVVTVAQ